MANTMLPHGLASAHSFRARSGPFYFVQMTRVDAKTKEWSQTAGKTILTVPGVRAARDEDIFGQGEGLLAKERRRDSGVAPNRNDMEMSPLRRRGGSGDTSVSRNSSENHLDGSPGRHD